MIICANCKKEMKCEITGIRCRWNGSHIYSGDLFKCQTCGTQIIHTNNTSYFSDNYKMLSDSDYFMDNYYEENLKQKNINFRRKKI